MRMQGTMAIKADLLVTHRHRLQAPAADASRRHHRHLPQRTLPSTRLVRDSIARDPAQTQLEGAARPRRRRRSRTRGNKRAIIPAGTLVHMPVAFETYGTLGARGDAYLRDVVRNYVRPVTWLDAPADKGPKFVDRPRWTLLHLPAETPRP